MSEAITALLNSGTSISVLVGVILSLVFYIIKKPKQQPLESLGPMVREAVKEVVIEKCKAEAYEGLEKDKKRVKIHSDKIETLKYEIDRDIEEIGHRLGGAEGRLIALEKDVEYIRGSICEIKKEIRDGNESIIKHIGTIGCSK